MNLKSLIKLACLIVLGGILLIGIRLGTSSGLKSDPSVGLAPQLHEYRTADVRSFTSAPLLAEVKVYLPITATKAMSIVSDFENYPNWVAPPPKSVKVDNIDRPDGKFGVGSLVSYKEGETDLIEFYDPNVGMIAKPLWGTSDFSGHRGVVFVTEHDNGIIMHMRRYFSPVTFKGKMMSKMMPMFMKNSAENLAEQYDGKVL